MEGDEAARGRGATLPACLRFDCGDNVKAKRTGVLSGVEHPCKRDDTESQTGTGHALDTVFVQSKIEFQCHNSADVKIIEALGDRWACARCGGTLRDAQGASEEGGRERRGSPRWRPRHARVPTCRSPAVRSVP